MDERIRMYIEKTFEEIIDENINNAKSKEPYLWQNDPFYSTITIRNSIALAKEHYKELLVKNNIEFGIQKFEVGNFIDKLSEKMNKKYFI